MYNTGNSLRTMSRVEEFINSVYKDKRAKRKVFENILKYAKNSVNENKFVNEKIVVKNKLNSSLFCAKRSKWTRRDSNPRPPPCEGGALPAELRALFNFYFSFSIFTMLIVYCFSLDFRSLCGAQQASLWSCDFLRAFF